MIVKNESATLEKCLATARPHVDEIVIVDTGSTDGTQEIARRYGDIFEEIEWPGSFSEARNYSFRLAGGDYIMVLDGDEYIDDTAEWKRIRKQLRSQDLAAIQLLIKNLLPEGQILAADRMYQTRIVVNDRRIRYEGKVHNQIDNSVRRLMDATGMQAVLLDVEVVHTGYSYDKPKMKEKYEPRLALLRDEFNNPRNDVMRAYYGYQLGVSYFVIQRYEDALDILGEIRYDLLTPQNAFYAHLLGAQSALKLHNAPAALVHCNEMLNISRAEPIAYHTTGLSLLLARQTSDGMLMLLEAFNINDAHRSDARFELNQAQLLLTLARICGEVGLTDHQRAFSKILEKGITDRRDLIRSIVDTLKKNLIFSEVNAARA